MPLQRDVLDLPRFFHLVHEKSNQGDVKPSRGRVKENGQLNPLFNSDTELELIEVYGDGRNCRDFQHFSSLEN